MSEMETVLFERDLLRVIARQSGEGFAPEYDVELEGQEILQTFPTFDEACQFVDMVVPSSRKRA